MDMGPVYGAIGACEGRGHTEEHEIVFVTNVDLAYAYSGEGEMLDAGPISCKGSRFTVVCNQPLARGGRCDGRVVFDTNERPQVGAGWSTNIPSRILLDTWGIEPDIED